MRVRIPLAAIQFQTSTKMETAPERHDLEQPEAIRTDDFDEFELLCLEESDLATLGYAYDNAWIDLGDGNRQRRVYFDE